MYAVINFLRLRARNYFDFSRSCNPTFGSGLAQVTISEAFGRAFTFRTFCVLEYVATYKLPDSNPYQTAVR